MKKLTIKSWSIDDRPREKFIEKGMASLSDAELIAILIGSGNREETAVDLAKRILSHVGNNLGQLSSLSLHQFKQFHGIGVAKAINIMAGLELGQRHYLKSKPISEKVRSSRDAFLIVEPIFTRLKHEEFWVLYLNNASKVLEKHQISKGGLTSTMVDVRLIYKKALELSAVALIICHNHPSGNLNPSESDKKLTSKIKRAGTSLDIKLLDHLIVTQKSYFSFADEGII